MLSIQLSLNVSQCKASPSVLQASPNFVVEGFSSSVNLALGSHVLFYASSLHWAPLQKGNPLKTKYHDCDF
jgi:hypothetical protein